MLLLQPPYTVPVHNIVGYILWGRPVTPEQRGSASEFPLCFLRMLCSCGDFQLSPESFTTACEPPPNLSLLSARKGWNAFSRLRVRYCPKLRRLSSWSWGLVHEWEKKWSICSNADSVSISCGEEKGEPKGIILCLLADLCFYTRLWSHVVDGGQKSKIPHAAAEMSFIQRVAGLSLRDGFRSSVIQEELGEEPIWFGHLVTMPPGWDMPNWEKAVLQNGKISTFLVV